MYIFKYTHIRIHMHTVVMSALWGLDTRSPMGTSTICTSNCKNLQVVLCCWAIAVTHSRPAHHWPAACGSLAFKHVGVTTLLVLVHSDSHSPKHLCLNHDQASARAHACTIHKGAFLRTLTLYAYLSQCHARQCSHAAM